MDRLDAYLLQSSKEVLRQSASAQSAKDTPYLCNMDGVLDLLGAQILCHNSDYCKWWRCILFGLLSLMLMGALLGAFALYKVYYKHDDMVARLSAYLPSSCS